MLLFYCFQHKPTKSFVAELDEPSCVELCVRGTEDDARHLLRRTHSVEHRGADGFHDEVVIHTQFLQVLVEVVWIQSEIKTIINSPETVIDVQPVSGKTARPPIRATRSLSGLLRGHGKRTRRRGEATKRARERERKGLTVHLNELVEVREDGGQLGGGQQLLPLQGLGEDHLQHTQHAHVGVLRGEQLWRGGGEEEAQNETPSLCFLACRFVSLLLTIDDLLPLGLLFAEPGQAVGGREVPPVGRVRLKLQQARLHLLQLGGGAGWGGAGPLG